MKKIISLLMICCMTITSTSQADPIQLPQVQKPANESDPGNVISPMKKGQSAPYTGVLLSPQAVATIIAELGSIDEKVKIETDKAVGKCVAESEFNFKEAQSKHLADKKVLQASIDEKMKRIQVLQDEIKKKEAERTNPYLWTGLGFTGGVAVTVLAAFAISQATK